MRAPILLLVVAFLSGCNNPGDVPDEDYAAYRELGAPKILYSCSRVSEPSADLLEVCADIAKSGKPDAIESAASCTQMVNEEAKKPMVYTGYTAGVGINATYNSILQDAKKDCGGAFTILESEA